MNSGALRIVLGLTAFIVGFVIFTTNLFFYKKIRQLKNTIGRKLFSTSWTGEFSSAVEIMERVMAIFLGLFFVVWAALILLDKLN